MEDEEVHARMVQPCSANLCFEIAGSIEEHQKELESKGLAIELMEIKWNFAVMHKLWASG